MLFAILIGFAGVTEAASAESQPPYPGVDQLSRFPKPLSAYGHPAGADAWIKRQLREGKERHIADVESLMTQRANSTLSPEDETISE